MFCEVADIQTADMLKLPVPKVNYHNIKTKPSEIQTEMVASLAKRAEKVRARLVEPNIDNMLKITNDGRKLALDQRMIDPMLPDDPDSYGYRARADRRTARKKMCKSGEIMRFAYLYC